MASEEGNAEAGGPLRRGDRIIEAEAKPELRAAIVLMAQAGLRVGGLPGLSITGSRWTTTTKGKDQAGKVSGDAREAITRAGLPMRSPFKNWTAGSIAKAFEYQARKLYAAGKIRSRYSVHDLRHAFAVRLYEVTHDVYRVEKALGHANVAVTETYLRSIGAVDGPGAGSRRVCNHDRIASVGRPRRPWRSLLGLSRHDESARGRKKWDGDRI